jgi:hypothetical protein
VTQVPFVNGALPLLAQARALSRVFVTSDSMDKDLPMPISSARMPPPVSEGKTGIFALVIAWQKLQE